MKQKTNRNRLSQSFNFEEVHALGALLQLASQHDDGALRDTPGFQAVSEKIRNMHNRMQERLSAGTDPEPAPEEKASTPEPIVAIKYVATEEPVVTLGYTGAVTIGYIGRGRRIAVHTGSTVECADLMRRIVPQLPKTMESRICSSGEVLDEKCFRDPDTIVRRKDRVEELLVLLVAGGCTVSDMKRERLWAGLLDEQNG